MIVDQLEAQARGRLPRDAEPGARVRVSAQRGGDRAQPLLRPPAKPLSGRTRALIEEVPITASGYQCTARPASFEWLTVCRTGETMPRFSTPLEARRWLTRQRAVAEDVLQALR